MIAACLVGLPLAFLVLSEEVEEASPVGLTTVLRSSGELQPAGFMASLLLFCVHSTGIRCLIDRASKLCQFRPVACNSPQNSLCLAISSLHQFLTDFNNTTQLPSTSSRGVFFVHNDLISFIRLFQNYESSVCIQVLLMRGILETLYVDWYWFERHICHS